MEKYPKTVKSILKGLKDLDKIIEEEKLDLDRLYQTIIFNLSDIVVDETEIDVRKFTDETGNVFIVNLIPGRGLSPCTEILLVLMFPTTIHGFHELSPITLPEDRLKEAAEHVKYCDKTRFVIFYGFTWDSLHWDRYRPYFRKVESILKLYKMVYTTLPK